MADGRFLRGHGLNLFHMQCECLEMLSILVPLLYTRVYHCFQTWTMTKLVYNWDPLDCCGTSGTIADGRFLRGHRLNLHHMQYECWGLLSILVTSLYTRVYRCFETWIIQVKLWQTPRLLWYDGWWSVSEGPWPQLISPAILMLRAA